MSDEELTPPPAATAAVETVIAVANGTGQSFRDELRAARDHAHAQQTEDFEVPGYDGRLWVTLRALRDYRDVRDVVMSNQRGEPVDRELGIAAETLARASVDTFYMQDGEKHPLGVTLGLGLAAYLGFDGAENDRQAVFLLIEDTVDVITLFADYDQWMKRRGRKADDDLEGKSGALS